MPAHFEEHISPYTTRQLYDVVADVKTYPEFVPWVSAARILSETDEKMQAELVVKFKSITQKYSSDIDLIAPDGNNDECKIVVTMLEGPFKHLHNHWKFIPKDDGAIIHFEIDFEFKSKMLEKMIGLIFKQAVDRMVTVFEDRAKALYDGS